MIDALMVQLLDPIDPSECFFGSWRIASVECPETDEPVIVFNLENESGSKVRLVLSGIDHATQCYDRTDSFNIAFHSEGNLPLTLDQEEALIHVIEAVRINDHGRYRIFRADGEKAPRLMEVEKERTMFTRMLDWLLPPKKTDTTSTSDQTSGQGSGLEEKSDPEKSDPE